MDQFAIRIATENDVQFLWQMLFEAAFWRADSKRPSLQAGLSNPAIAKILANWGREGDLAVIAHSNDQPIGAAWLRFWTESNHSYGFINHAIPELGIGVVANWRRRGIGRALLQRMIDEAVTRGIGSISLSVEQDNFARDLYLSEGFVAIGRLDSADTMLLQLANFQPGGPPPEP